MRCAGRSPPRRSATKLYCAPGNAGIAEDAELRADRGRRHRRGWSASRASEKIDFVVVGPEAPLVAGLVDRLRGGGHQGLRPDRRGRRALEGSKGFTKDLCAKHRHPDRRLRPLHRAPAGQGLRRGRRARRSWSRPTGSPPARAWSSPRPSTRPTAAIDDMLADRLRRRRRRGRDRGIPRRRGSVASSRWSTARPRCRWPPRRTTSASATATPAPTPAAWAPIRRRRSSRRRWRREVMARDHPADGGGDGGGGARPSRACSIAGLMLTADGPKLHRIQRPLRRSRVPGADACGCMSDLLPALLAARDGVLDNVRSALARRGGADRGAWRPRAIPAATRRAARSAASSSAAEMPGVQVFHAGTAAPRTAGSSPTAGACWASRALGDDVAEARERAYRARSTAIDWPEGFCRRDIGWRAIARLEDR